MSYDLAVWEGDRPADDVSAASEVERLYDRYIASEDRAEPTARIAAYVAALLERYPDIGTEAGADSPWSTGPLMSEACTYHHHLIHEGDWQARIAPDGHPEYLPPAHIDPSQRPRRNIFHRT